jgi:hypothetical protein
MVAQRLLHALTLSVLPLTAMAGNGLVPPAADTLWPRWHARIAVQGAQTSTHSISSLAEGRSSLLGLQGGALLGDYHFAQRWFGVFRASGGLLMGVHGGAPVLSADIGTRLGLTVLRGESQAPLPGAYASDSTDTVPYLGVGFSSDLWKNALSVTADLGLVASQPSAALGVGRALFGNQGMERAMREMRIAPLLQLGVRYAF